MKTYENFIKNIFLPKEFDNLVKVLCYLFYKILPDYYEIHIENIKNGKIIKIGQVLLLVTVLYDHKKIEIILGKKNSFAFSVINRNNHKKLNNLFEFLQFILNSYITDIDYFTTESEEIHLIIPLDEVKNIITEISQDNYETFLIQKDFNL